MLAGVGADASLAGVGPGKMAWLPLVLNDRLCLLECGVGKANAAAAVARAFDAHRHAGVVNLGLAGALPDGGLSLCDAVLATVSIYADEGSENPEGFTDLASMGFAPNLGLPGVEPATGVAGSGPLLARLSPLADRIGPIATVSTCAGTGARAWEVVRRTGAIAEAMEGAAIAFTLAHLTGGAGDFAEVRVISNTTGDRPDQVWRLRDSLARLADIASRL